MYSLVRYHEVRAARVAAVPYVGPGDVISGAAAWWGLRAYRAASVGISAVRLRESGGNTEQDFAIIAGGGLDTAAIASFAAGASLFITKLYDQTGNTLDMVQATGSSQPQFILGGLGPLSVIRLVYPTAFMETAANLSQSQPFTLSWVAKRTSAFFNYGALLGSKNGSVQTGFDTSPNGCLIYAGTVQAITATDEVLHAVQAVFNGASSDLNIDGSANTTSPGPNATNTPSAQPFAIAEANAVGGDMAEGGLWPSVFSGTNSTNINANQRAYWIEGGYVGPGDIVGSAAAWWGLRAYTKAGISALAVRLRRSSDNAEKDFRTTYAGKLDVAAVAAWASGNLFVTKLYDQSGGGFDLAQTTSASQPAFILSALGALPVISADGVNDWLIGTTNDTFSKTNSTFSHFANCTDSNTQRILHVFPNIIDLVTGYGGVTSNDVFLNAAATKLASAAADFTWHACQAVFNSPASNSDMNVDGVANIGASGGVGTTSSDTHALFNFASGAQWFKGFFTEAGSWKTAFTGTNSTNMSANQRDFYLNYDAVASWVNTVIANGGTVSSGRRTLISNLISGLKSDGVWAKLDRLWIFAAENSVSALVDLVGNTLATAVSSPTFTADRGYAGNGSTSYVDTNYIPSRHGVNYTLNAAHFSVWDNAASYSSIPMGVRGLAGNNSALIFPNISNLTQVYCNDDNPIGNITPRIADGNQSIIVSRTSGSALSIYTNGSAFGGSPYTSTPTTTLPDISFFVGGRNNVGLDVASTDQISAVSHGGALTATDASNLYSRLRTYMTAVGVP